jgi:hypothetical protein
MITFGGGTKAFPGILKAILALHVWPAIIDNRPYSAVCGFAIILYFKQNKNKNKKQKKN